MVCRIVKSGLKTLRLRRLCNLYPLILRPSIWTGVVSDEELDRLHFKSERKGSRGSHIAPSEASQQSTEDFCPSSNFDFTPKCGPRTWKDASRESMALDSAFLTEPGTQNFLGTSHVRILLLKKKKKKRYRIRQPDVKQKAEVETFFWNLVGWQKTGIPFCRVWGC